MGALIDGVYRAARQMRLLARRGGYQLTAEGNVPGAASHSDGACVTCNSPRGPENVGRSPMRDASQAQALHAKRACTPPFELWRPDLTPRYERETAHCPCWCAAASVPLRGVRREQGETRFTVAGSERGQDAEHRRTSCLTVIGGAMTQRLPEVTLRPRQVHDRSNSLDGVHAYAVDTAV